MGRVWVLVQFGEPAAWPPGAAAPRMASAAEALRLGEPRREPERVGARSGAPVGSEWRVVSRIGSTGHWATELIMGRRDHEEALKTLGHP